MSVVGANNKCHLIVQRDGGNRDGGNRDIHRGQHYNTEWDISCAKPNFYIRSLSKEETTRIINKIQL